MSINVPNEMIWKSERERKTQMQDKEQASEQDMHSYVWMTE